MKYNLKVSREIIKQHCQHEQNWSLSNFEEWFYTLKALICIWLTFDTPRTKPGYSDYIIACYLDGGSYYVPGEPTMYWSRFISVGHGYFQNWFAYEDEDGT